MIFKPKYVKTNGINIEIIREHIQKKYILDLNYDFDTNNGHIEMIKMCARFVV